MPASSAFPILDAALDGVILMDATGRIVELNASAEAIFGWRREQMVGRHLADAIIPERFREAHRRGLARYLETGASSVLGKRLALSALRADGSEFPVELTISSSAIGGEKVFVGFIRDMTEWFAVEEQRARARADASAALSRIERLQASTAVLAAARTVDDVAEAVLAAGIAALGADTGVFVRRFGDELGIAASVGLPEAVRLSFRRLARDVPTPAAAVFRSGEPEWVEDEKTFRARYGHVGDALKTAVASAAALPLRIGDTVAAAVVFRFERERRFAEADRALLQTFAAQAAQALDRVLSYEQELEGRKKLEALADLTSRLATTMSEADVADAVIEGGMASMAADTCMLYRIEPDGALGLIAERGCSPVVVDAIRRIPMDSENPSAQTVRTGRSLWIESDAEYHALLPALAGMRAEGPRARAFWSVPMIVEGQTIGLLGMGFYGPRRFSRDERVFAETFARSAGQALRRAQQLATETRIRRSMETTLRSIGDAVIATDTAGAITFFNPVAERLTGWAQDKALGRAVHEVFRIVNEETRAPVESPVERVRRGGVVVGLANHTLLLAKDGREIPIDDSGAPIRGAGDAMMGVVLVFRDVTAKKREERRRSFLADAASTFASSLDYDATLGLVAGLTVPLFADWCAVDLSEPDGALRRVATAHVDPVKTRLAREMGDRYPPDPSAPNGVPNVLRTGVSELYARISEAGLRAVAKDDEHLRALRALQIRSAMVIPLLARGQTLGAITFAYAESGRAYSSDDLAFAEDLARRAAIAIDNARLYAAEQRARQAADFANRVKDEFLATVSHELRTPLNAIMGWAKLLGLAAAEPDRLARAVETIERNAVAMAHLIDDLLDVSRIVSGKIRLEVETVDLARIVEATVESARPGAAAKQVTIDLSPSEEALLEGDPKRLEQVVSNLLSNAVKFSNKGGRVSIALLRDASAFQLHVRDEGRGIDPRFLPFVFDPFRQADASITRKHGGLGLGLAITRELVQLHGGEVRATSAGEGHGATFIVSFPFPVEPRASVAPASAGSVTPFERPRELEGLHVLVVDDEDDARHLVRTILEDCGCSVRTAPSARSALEQMETGRTDVLVSDIGMPHEDGYALIRKIRKLPMPRGGVPALALTAFTRSEDRRRALEAGFTMHLAKPIDPVELVTVLAGLARGGAG